MSNNKVPCIECICLPTCRHKLYIKLFSECDILDKHIPLSGNVYTRNSIQLEELQEILKPSRWGISGMHPYQAVSSTNMEGTNI